MKVIEMSKHRERADPRETAKSLESLIEENKIRGVDPQETLVWCISFCFSASLKFLTAIISPC